MVKMHKSYSLRQWVLFLAAAMIAIIFGVVYSITSYYNGLLKEQYYQQAQDSIGQYTRQKQTELGALEHYLLQYGSTDGYVQTLDRAVNENDLYHAKMCVFNTFNSNIVLFGDVEGMFLYSPNSRQFTCSSTAFYQNTCYADLKELFDGWEEVPQEQKREMLTGWTMLSSFTGHYLVRMLFCPSGIIGAWVKTERISSQLEDIFPGDNAVFLLDDKQQVIGKLPYEEFTWLEKKDKEYQIYKDKEENISYLEVDQDFLCRDCRIVSLTPLYVIDRRLVPVYGRLAIILLIMLVGLMLVAVSFRRFIAAPIDNLNHLLEEIQYHEDAVVEDRANDPVEMQQLNKVLNRMISEIKGLRIRVYEEKLAQSQLEIQLLKSQISPHFLINCLSAFTSLACARQVDKDLIHRFSYVLSQHIRYTFSTRRTSSLEKEFSHIDNYLELISIRYPDSLSYDLKLPKECRGASITPMLILTLCENTIKHNMILGKLLTITVSAEMQNTGKGSQLHITYVDSGCGYPPDVLEWNNHILEHENEYRSGEHIGMYNICRSLKLNFGERADLRFTNEPGLGARTDIWLPYEPAESES